MLYKIILLYFFIYDDIICISSSSCGHGQIVLKALEELILDSNDLVQFMQWYHGCRVLVPGGLFYHDMVVLF